MKLGRQINLFVLILLVALATSLMVIGYFAIERIILRDHTTTFTRELDNIDLNIHQSYEELKESGLIGLTDYVTAEQERLLGILKEYQFGNTGRFHLLTTEGQFVLNGEDQAKMSFNEEHCDQMLSLGAGQLRYELDGRKYFAAFRHSSNWDWLMVLTIDEGELFAARNFYLKLALSFSLAALILAAFFSLIMSHKLQRRIDSTLNCLHKAEGGDLKARLPSPPSDEIGSIQSGINKMISTVASKTNDLKNANKAKSVFLANMSHELRTPLNSVLGFSDLMSRDPLVSAKQIDGLNVIQRNGHYLLKLINDVLDMSKIEAGRIELELEPTNLHILLDEIRDMIKPQITNKALKFSMELSAKLPQYVLIDRYKLRQVLTNLLDNAIKYTRAGIIILRADEKYTTDNKLTLFFEVEDTGIGIPTSDIETIFEPFSQITKTADTRKGTGLGLAITKKFVNLMGGDLTVDSTPDKGSIFQFEIPTEITETKQFIKNKLQRIVGLASDKTEWRILIVEDNADNRLLLRNLIEPVGFKIKVAVNGQDAIEQFEDWQPHLIWMDIRMPVMDGYEATRRIRELPSGKEVKILALTASAFKEQDDLILVAGCNAVLHKPYDESAIFSIMAEQLGISYIYEEPSELLNQDTLSELELEDLQELPNEWLDDFLTTARIGDTEQMLSLTNTLTSEHVETKAKLEHCVNNFQLQYLIKLLEENRSTTQKNNYYIT